MNKLCKITVLTILLTSCLCLNTNCSEVNAETYVSKNGFVVFQLTQHSGFFFAQHIIDSVKVKKPNSVDVQRTQNLKLKNPNIAIFYAVIPGVIVHGSGHFYAGRTGTGIMLVGAELVGGFLMFAGALSDWGENRTLEEQNREAARGLELSALGTLLFVGSWIYDLIGSPLAVKKHNQKLLEKQNPGVKFNFDHRSDFIGFRTYLSF